MKCLIGRGKVNLTFLEFFRFDTALSKIARFAYLRGQLFRSFEKYSDTQLL